MHASKTYVTTLLVIACVVCSIARAPTTITVMGVETHEAKDESRVESIKQKERTLEDYKVIKMPADGLCVG